MVAPRGSDVFLSYSRADANAVEAVRARLSEAGITSFLDLGRLPAGQPWQPFLERELGRAGAVAVFLGGRMGSWQHREVQVALDRQSGEDDFPVIPVLLPGLDDEPKGFLALQTWVDLRAGTDDPIQLQNLIAAIYREAPEGAAAIKAAICPYRGLLPFREEDAAFFFGRDDWIKDLTAKVQAHRLVAVVGRSGSGKSSLVFAGLFPALRKNQGGTTWDMLALRPGHEPLNALAEALSPPPEDATPAERIEKINADADRLRRGTVRLDQLVRHHLDGQTGTDRLLLYVDQWEELYTLAARADGGRAGRDEQADPEIARQAAHDNRGDVTPFIDLLLAAAGEHESRLTVVLTVRADFYDHLLRHPTLPAAIQGQQLNLGPMRRTQLQQCIEGPAAAVGLGFEGTLVESILDDVGEDEGKLPLLEYALRETWEASRKARQDGGLLTFAAYNVIGRVGGAIGTRAEQIYEKLDEAQRQAARRLFVSLVTPGEGQEDTRARTSVPDEPAMAEVVREFSDPAARLLVTGWDQSRGERLAEVSHEALIRNWGTLRGWIAANREILRTRDRIRGQMKHWEQENEPDDLLLQRGRALEEGRQLLTSHGDVLVDDIRPYVDRSIEHDQRLLEREQRDREEEQRKELEREQERQLWLAQKLTTQRTRLGLIAASILLLVAVGAGAEAFRYAHYSDGLLARAIKIASDFMGEALRVADQQGVPRKVIDDLVRSATGAYEGLNDEIAKAPWLPWRAEAPSLPWRQPAALARLRGQHALLLLVAADFDGKAGNIEQQRRIAEQARSELAGVIEDEPSEPEWRAQLALSDDLIADAHAREWQVEEALVAYRAALAVRQELAAGDPENQRWQREIALSQTNIGDMLRRQGRWGPALDAYRTAQATWEHLAAAAPPSAQLQRDLLMGQQRVGDVLLQQGEYEAAEATYRAALASAERLAGAEPENVQAQRDRAVSLDKLGNALRAQGDGEAALAAYQASLATAQSLAAADPANAGLQRDVFKSYEAIGSVRFEQGELEPATVAFEAALAIAEPLAAADPAHGLAQRELSVLRNRLGDVFEAQGQLDAALAEYRKALDARRTLAAADPTNVQAQRDLSLSYERLGDVLRKQGRWEEALVELDASLAIARRLARAEPSNVDAQRDLLTRYVDLGQLQERKGSRAEAQRSYCQAKAVSLALTDLEPESDEWRQRRAWIEERLQAVQGGGPGPC